MAALDTVADYVGDSRTLLQDVIAPYRYDDPSLVVALNLALLEVRRLRADLFVYAGATMPYFTVVDTTSVPIEPPFRLALVFGVCGHALARDQEDVQDARATTFMNNFYAMLLGTRLPGIGGGGAQPSAAAAPPNRMPGQ